MNADPAWRQVACSRVLRAAACWLLVASAVACHAAPASIEGNWLNPSVGTADNHTAVALAIARNDRGELVVKATVPIVNFFGIALGNAEADGPGKYAIRAQEITLTLQAPDTLVVTGLLNDVVTTQRSSGVPAPAVRTPPPTGPGPRWQVRLGGPIYAMAANRDGVVYVGNTDGVMFALEAGDGTKVWTFSAGRAIYGAALASEDAIYFASDNGYLYKLGRDDGKERWHYDLGDGRVARIPPNPFVFDYDDHAPTPVLADGVIFIGAGDGGFHAVKADSGERLWRIQSNAKIRTTAAIDGDHVIFATMDGLVGAVERTSGVQVWSSKQADAYTSGPALADGIVVVGNRSAVLRGLDAGTGAERWHQDCWSSWVESTAVFRDGRGYIGSGDLFLVSCFEPKTGRNLWRTHVNGWVMRSPAVTGQHVYVGVSGAHRRSAGLLPQSGALTVLDRETGNILWSWPMPEWPGAFLSGFFATPVVAGDSVLVGGLDGTLYAFAEHD